MREATLVAATALTVTLAAAPAHADNERPIPAEPQVAAQIGAPVCVDGGKTRAFINIENHAGAATWVRLHVRRPHLVSNRSVYVEDARRVRVRTRAGRPIAATLLDSNDRAVAVTEFAGYPC